MPEHINEEYVSQFGKAFLNCDNNCTNYLAYKSVGYVIGTLTEVLLATQGKIAKRVLN